MEPLFVIVRAVLIATHLLCNALAGGGPVVAVLLPDDPHARRRLAWWSLLALAAGAVAGALSVLVVLAGGYPGYADAAARLPARAYGMLTGEWLFSAVLLLIYYRITCRSPSRRFWHGLIAVVAATNLLYHYPTMMVVLGQLAQEPDLTHEATIARPVFLDLLCRPFPLAKSAHFWSLSLVSAGVAGLCVSENQRGRLIAAITALLGVSLLFLSGVGQLLAAPAGVARELLTLQTAAGWCFLGGLVCAMLLLANLCQAVADRRPRCRRMAVTLTVTVLLMSAAAVSA